VSTPPTDIEIDALLSAYQGTIMQTPPVFSAIRVGGKRAYAEARAGRPPELEARPVQVHRIHRVGGSWPVVELEIHCEKGFYVRSLARELGEKLGTGGHCLSITRTAVGPFVLDEAVSLDPLPAELGAKLIPLQDALRRVGVNQDEAG
jgi:tRNA pseudouridine55 synthase